MEGVIHRKMCCCEVGTKVTGLNSWSLKENQGTPHYKTDTGTRFREKRCAGMYFAISCMGLCRSRSFSFFQFSWHFTRGSWYYPATFYCVAQSWAFTPRHFCSRPGSAPGVTPQLPGAWHLENQARALTRVIGNHSLCHCTYCWPQKLTMCRHPLL